MANATTTNAGFYGTEDSTYYVTPEGRVWVVQTDDLIDTPRRVRGDQLPEGATPVDDLVQPEEAEQFLQGIEAEAG